LRHGLDAEPQRADTPAGADAQELRTTMQRLQALQRPWDLLTIAPPRDELDEAVRDLEDPSRSSTPPTSGADREASWIMLPRTILVPIDFSTCSERALDYAFTLAEKLDATVSLVTAVGAEHPGLGPTLSDPAVATIRRDRIAGLEKLVGGRSALAKVGTLEVVFGDARDMILRTAAELGADMIVMGTHGRRGIPRLVLGSVAEEVVRRATCPVVTVRQEKPS